MFDFQYLLLRCVDSQRIRVANSVTLHFEQILYMYESLFKNRNFDEIFVTFLISFLLNQDFILNTSVGSLN